MGTGFNHAIDERGNAYGFLTVVEQSMQPAKSGQLRWICVCSCGSASCKGKVEVPGARLRAGQTMSCGSMQGRRYADPTQSAVNRIITTYKRTADERGLEWKLDVNECRKLFEAPCVYCGAIGSNACSYKLKSPEQYRYNGIDRIDNGCGYEPANVVSCCRICNHAKSDMTVQEFDSWIVRLCEFRNGGN